MVIDLLSIQIDFPLWNRTKVTGTVRGCVQRQWVTGSSEPESEKRTVRNVAAGETMTTIEQHTS